MTSLASKTATQGSNIEVKKGANILSEKLIKASLLHLSTKSLIWLFFFDLIIVFKFFFSLTIFIVFYNNF